MVPLIVLPSPLLHHIFLLCGIFGVGYFWLTVYFLFVCRDAVVASRCTDFHCYCTENKNFYNQKITALWIKSHDILHMVIYVVIDYIVVIYTHTHMCECFKPVPI